MNRPVCATQGTIAALSASGWRNWSLYLTSSLYRVPETTESAVSRTLAPPYMLRPRSANRPACSIGTVFKRERPCMSGSSNRMYRTSCFDQSSRILSTSLIQRLPVSAASTGDADATPEPSRAARVAPSCVDGSAPVGLGSVRSLGWRQPVLKLFFATDVHGSETTFRKWLNSAGHYGADVLLMGGDITGKMLVPIVKELDGTWTARYEGARVAMQDEKALAEVERALRQRGYYTQRMTPEERDAVQTPEQVEELFKGRMAEVLTHWVGLADERLDPGNVPAVWMPGNDDLEFIDPYVSSSKAIQNGGDPEMAAPALASRPHPRVLRRHQDRPHPVHQHGVGVSRGRAPWVARHPG